jgi:hypothetical protein
MGSSIFIPGILSADAEEGNSGGWWVGEPD